MGAAIDRLADQSGLISFILGASDPYVKSADFMSNNKNSKNICNLQLMQGQNK